MSRGSKPVALVLGPALDAMSGVTTHVNLLLGSPLAMDFDLRHFQVGSEGRQETRVGRLLRLAVSPFRLLGEILRTDAALVHVNTSLNKAYWRDLAYVAVAKLCGAKVVYQVHGGELPKQFFRNSTLRKFLERTIRIPDAVVVLASTELEAYTEFVPGQLVLALPNGISCRPFGRYNRAAPSGPLRLTYIGRLSREKGLFESLEALRLARFQGVDARLVLAGGGPDELRLKARVKDLGLTRDVAFAGAVDGERKARLLAQADVLLLPSYSEGLPYALLEGMAAGAVPIATPVGAIPDVMSEGMHGLFVPPRDPAAIAQAIGRLAGDRAAIARMSAACRKRIASAYSIERLAEEFTTLYAQLLSARAPKTVP